jgi:hypothetical protein
MSSSRSAIIIEMSPAAAAVRQEIERAIYLEGRTVNQGDLLLRMDDVINAQRAIARREEAARYVLRQALINLASASESIAAELPEPTLPRS